MLCGNDFMLIRRKSGVLKVKVCLLRRKKAKYESNLFYDKEMPTRIEGVFRGRKAFPSIPAWPIFHESQSFSTAG